MKNIVRYIVLALAAVVLVGLAQHTTSDTGRAQARTTASPVTIAAEPVAATTAVAKKKDPKRYIAMRFALKQKGKPYIYGGNGPRGYDCSGLVVAAYKKAGISLPRTTQSLRNSSKLIKVARSKAMWGDVVMWGNTHIEFVSSANKWSFGAHKSGTKIGYRHYYGSPTFFRIAGAH